MIYSPFVNRPKHVWPPMLDISDLSLTARYYNCIDIVYIVEAVHLQLTNHSMYRTLLTRPY